MAGKKQEFMQAFLQKADPEQIRQAAEALMQREGISPEVLQAFAAYMPSRAPGMQV